MVTNGRPNECTDWKFKPALFSCLISIPFTNLVSSFQSLLSTGNPPEPWLSTRHEVRTHDLPAEQAGRALLR